MKKEILKQSFGLGRNLTPLVASGFGLCLRANKKKNNHLKKFISSLSSVHTKLNPLKNKQFLLIKSWIALGLRRGMRHKLALPVNGQRSKTNARTQRKRKHVFKD